MCTSFCDEFIVLFTAPTISSVGKYGKSRTAGRRTSSLLHPFLSTLLPKNPPDGRLGPRKHPTCPLSGSIPLLIIRVHLNDDGNHHQSLSSFDHFPFAPMSLRISDVTVQYKNHLQVSRSAVAPPVHTPYCSRWNHLPSPALSLPLPTSACVRVPHETSESYPVG